jgi:hypothetical protein
VIDSHTIPLQPFVTLSGLPAGTYLAWADVNNNLIVGTNDSNKIYCQFVDGSGNYIQPDADFPYITVEPAHDVTVSGVANLPANGSLTVRCDTDTPGDSAAYGTITALRVDQLN